MAKERSREGRGLNRTFQDRIARTDNNDKSNITAHGPENKIGYKAPEPPKRKR